MSKILFICIDYNTAKKTEQLLSDLEACRHKGLNAVVVNNSRDTESIEKFELRSSDVLPVEVLTPEKNLGYFGGAQAALSVYLTRQESPPDWVIVSNSDIRIQQSNFFSILSNCDDADVVGPKIVSSRTGRNQNPYMVERPTHWKMNAYKWIFSNYPTSWPYQTMYAIKQILQPLVPKRQSNEEGEDALRVYAVHGSFMAFNKSYFLKGGNFKHGCFLYGEEIYVAEIARQKDLKVVYKPELTVEHNEHASVGLFPSLKKLSYIKESSRYCADNFFRI